MSEKRLANSSFEGVTFTGSFKDVNDHETDYSLCKELLRKTNNIVNNKYDILLIMFVGVIMEFDFDNYRYFGHATNKDPNAINAGEIRIDIDVYGKSQLESTTIEINEKDLINGAENMLP